MAFALICVPHMLLQFASKLQRPTMTSVKQFFKSHFQYRKLELKLE